ncbi:unnamed protein product [Trifolium pratense]|uniref:Uncharacterized protein n=1 Tax=Trifolium pratense TaxID=57577 RepID=A0ACB0IMQ8_TRIPR|nr:unnamed protein product [Trifolium pratense]
MEHLNFLDGALEASKEGGTTFIVKGQHAKHYEEGLLQLRYVVRLSGYCPASCRPKIEGKEEAGTIEKFAKKEAQKVGSS